jgi:hypothetical protein
MTKNKKLMEKLNSENRQFIFVLFPVQLFDCALFLFISLLNATQYTIFGREVLIFLNFKLKNSKY